MPMAGFFGTQLGWYDGVRMKSTAVGITRFSHFLMFLVVGVWLVVMIAFSLPSHAFSMVVMLLVALFCCCSSCLLSSATPSHVYCQNDYTECLDLVLPTLKLWCFYGVPWSKGVLFFFDFYEGPFMLVIFW